MARTRKTTETTETFEDISGALDTRVRSNEGQSVKFTDARVHGFNDRLAFVGSEGRTKGQPFSGTFGPESRTRTAAETTRLQVRSALLTLALDETVNGFGEGTRRLIYLRGLLATVPAAEALLRVKAESVAALTDKALADTDPARLTEEFNRLAAAYESAFMPIADIHRAV